MVIFAASLSSMACKTTSPVIVLPEPKISLTSVETAATEAWLQLKTGD